MSTKKVDAAQATQGDQGQAFLAEGDRVAMRLWEEEPGDAQDKESHTHAYETVGYVIEGRAELRMDGETVELSAGDSWVVPADTEHTYRIVAPFKAVEATSPPARWG